MRGVLPRPVDDVPIGIHGVEVIIHAQVTGVRYVPRPHGPHGRLALEAPTEPLSLGGVGGHLYFDLPELVFPSELLELQVLRLSDQLGLLELLHGRRADIREAVAECRLSQELLIDQRLVLLFRIRVLGEPLVH